MDEDAPFRKINKVVFYVAYFFFLLYAFFGTIDFLSAPLKLLTDFSIVMTGLVFITQLKAFRFNYLIKIILFFSLSLIFIIHTGNFLFLKLLLIVVVSRDVAFFDRISFDMRLRIVFLIFMVFLCLFGVVGDATALYDGVVRHSMGFTNPNVFGMHTMILCLEIVYLRTKKNVLRSSFYRGVLFCLVLSIVSYYVCGSRTSFVISLLSIVLAIIYRYRQSILQTKFLRFLIKYSPLITSVAVLVLYELYINGSSFGIEANNIMSGRLFSTKYFVDNYPISLFGNEISSAVKSCDVTVVYMLYAFGLTGLIMYLCCFKNLLKRLLKTDYLLAIIMFLFVIYGMSEKLWLFADCNIFMTAFSYLLHEKKRSR